MAQATVTERFRKYWVEDASFIALLVMMVFVMFFLPSIIELEVWPSTMLHTSLMAVFFVGMWSARQRVVQVLAVTVFLVSLILNVLLHGYEETGLKTILWTTYSINTLLFIITNVDLLFRDDKFNVHRILGAINVYLLCGLLGALLFEQVYLLFGSSLLGNVELEGADNDFGDYVYFSMTALTTAGFGDVYPGNSAARMLAVFLATVGILFPAVVIAKLISSAYAQSADSE